MTTSHTQNPRVGVGVFILRSSTSDRSDFIMGKRKGSHGAGLWALPGGHLEFGESFEECAVREVREETGLEVVNVRFLTATNDVMESENKHYITIFVVCECASESDPELLEPDKCEKWEWVEWNQLQQWVERQDTGTERLLFSPMVNLLTQRPGAIPARVIQ